MKIRLALIFALFTVIIYAQQITKIDSLKLLIKEVDSVEVKIKLYNQLTWLYYDSKNDSMEYAAIQSLKLSQESNNHLQEVIALENIGFYYDVIKNQYDITLSKYQEAEKICIRYNFNYIKEIYNDIGVVYQLTDDYIKADKYYQKAYKEGVKAKDKPMIKKSLANLASVNSSLARFDQSEAYFKECLSITYQGYESTHQIALANLANLYNRREQYVKALSVLQKAMDFRKKNNLKNCMEEAEDLVFLLDIKSKINDFSSFQQDVKKAEKCFEKNLPLRQKSLLTLSLANYISKKGNYRKAFDLQKKYIVLYDSVKFLQRDEIVYELEEKYQTQKRNEKINLLETENLKKKIDLERKSNEQRQTLLFLLFVLFLLSIFIYFYFSKKKQAKLLEEKNKIISTTLKENEILLKETHHRVKNSLQMISSLLYLQSESISNKEAADSVKEGHIRVKSMALIHQKLYQKDHLTGVDVADYIQDLAFDVFQSHHFSEQDIKLSLNVEQMLLDIDTITPLGIILNELIVNVLKHAFTKKSLNPILLISFINKGNALVLKVSDNGVGSKSYFIDNQSFGMKLINSLARGLKADLNIENDNGTKITLIIHRFKIIT